MGGLVIETVRPGVQFTAEAAAAFRRAEAQVRREFGRAIDVNSTWRNWDIQLSMYNAWQSFIKGRGPYPGHSKALHPADPLAFHTKGTALDSDDWVNPRIVAILAENGFIRNRLYVANENHHFEYIRDRDKNYGAPAGGGSSRPAATSDDQEEDEVMGYYFRDVSDANRAYRFFNEARGKSRVVTKQEWESRKAVASTAGGVPLPRLVPVSKSWYDKIVALGTY
ncbi:endolysin [Microbacterium phage Footloose]|uniref:Endolysin n=1 Tax=Microbacterium phage Footloose TaxID=2836048 RepID=A0A8F3ECQ9_9CAUD|nr:endolysin [Microbacterium phage Footloose]QWY84605.1 endolysin [Microbacterium phage Footloose]